ncbi:MAG: hypothetical protein AAFX04_13205 [Pseudomonadota bacterium]
MKTRNLTIRLGEEERERLERKAGEKPLAVYIRHKLGVEHSDRPRPSRNPKADSVMLARILAALGSSDMAASMRQIAAAAKNGALPESSDTLLQIQAACLTIQKMRADLIKALGVKPED